MHLYGYRNSRGARYSGKNKTVASDNEGEQKVIYTTQMAAARKGIIN